MIDCRNVKDQIEMLAIQSPNVSESEELREHLESCEVCRKQLHETREAWLLLPASLERRSATQAMETALLDRINSEPNVEASSTTRHWRVAAIGRYVLAASVLIALLAGTFIAPRIFRGGVDIADQHVARIKNFARAMDKLDRLQDVFATPNLQFVSFTSFPSSQDVQGYLVFDLTANEGHFFGIDLEKTNQQAFKVWLLDQSGDVISSASVDVAENGMGAAVVPLPEDLSILREAVITAETQLDALRPSSAVYMRTNVAR